MKTNDANTTAKPSKVDRAIAIAGLLLNLLQLLAALAALCGIRIFLP